VSHKEPSQYQSAQDELIEDKAAKKKEAIQKGEVGDGAWKPTFEAVDLFQKHSRPI
jgi:hypothetical protein